MTLAGLVRAKQDFAIAVFRHLARLLALFFVLGSVCANASAQTNVYLNGLPYSVQYGQQIRLATYATQTCAFGYGNCRIFMAAPYFVNKTNGNSFSSNPRNLAIDYFERTFIAGVAEDGQTLFPMGQSMIVASYQGVETGRYVTVEPRRVVTGIYAEKNQVQVGEQFNIASSAQGYLATGTLSMEMSDSKGVKNTIYSQPYATQTNQMEFGIGITLSRPGTYYFSTKFASTVSTNSSAESDVFAVTIAPATTTNTLAISKQAPIPLASPFVLTSRIAGTWGSATGIVEFYDGDVLLGRAFAQNNQASIVTALTKDLGTHNFHAKYLGDEFNKASVSADVSVAFSQAQPVTTVVSSQNPLVWSAPVTLDARIAGANPAGQMAFYDGDNLLGTSTITAGAASLSISSLAVGDHSITARYAGDALNLASTSAALLQKVGKADTAVQLTSINSAPITPGSSLIFMADLSGTGTGRSGTVNFYDGTALLGSSTLQNNQATLGSVKLATLGLHQIRAEYSGDQNFNGSTSGNLGINVELAGTTSTLSSSAAKVFNGMPIRFSLRVTGAAPTGTASFFADGKPLGSAALVDGVATLTTKLGQPGLRAITATYNGDGNNQPSSAQAISQLVKFNPALLELMLQILLN